MDSIINWIVGLMETLGSPGVGIAILLENLFPPIPSEVVLPLAGFTVAKGSLNFVSVFIFATLGSVVGAYLLYGLGAWLGADRLRKIADWMWLVKVSDVDKSLAWFDKYGKPSIFFGRLIPGIRSLISIPAGLDRMSLVTFGLWTTFGSAIWNAILIYLGFVLGDQWETVTGYVDQYSKVVYVILLLILLGFGAFFIRRAIKEKGAGPRAEV
ncbi:DedA family protein [Corynebacterium aquatimens]|uniref:Membrane protein DedA with SNARE-associated domain n=1 Tax=Corynebacterium aquatimens TaxID=1190508 RepID=A0A931DYN3_9CORY|nr:DedA family protein [Corynebacterium aquatimens]MBG6121103.1 membrane protein DedA with SNARE-associated domain [Corynebacterium aquatimens]WJY66341.1 Inner membrane protein YqjA [Corynebacterium aquatimens]